MFGSTNEADPIEVEEINKRLSKSEAATVQGLHTELEIVKQRMEHLYEKLERTHRLMGTINNTILELQRARVRELNVKVNGGPTDHGAYDRPFVEEGDDPTS